MNYLARFIALLSIVVALLSLVEWAIWCADFLEIENDMSYFIYLMGHSIINGAIIYKLFSPWFDFIAGRY